MASYILECFTASEGLFVGGLGGAIGILFLLKAKRGETRRVMLGYISIVVWWAGCAIIPWAGFIWWFWSGEFAAPEVAVVFGEVFVEEMVQVRFVVDGCCSSAPVGEPGFAFGARASWARGR